MATRPAPRPATRPAPRPASPPVPRAAPAQPKAPVGSQTRQQMLVSTAGMVGQQATGSRMAGMPEAGGPLNAQSGPYVQMPTPGPAPSALPVIPGCPVGLEYLTMIDHLLVQQQLQIKELFLGMQFNNKFIVKNNMGQFVFEEIENCYWHTLSSRRPFHMSLRDYRNIEVLKIVRPHRCDCFLCYCCLQVMDVLDASGDLIGSLRMEFAVINSIFSVLDRNENVVLLIKGPCCITSICCEDVKFDILTTDDVTKIGEITKIWAGCFREACSEADHFAVTFPLDLDAKFKAVLLGAFILIDYIYYKSRISEHCPCGGYRRH